MITTRFILSETAPKIEMVLKDYLSDADENICCSGDTFFFERYFIAPGVTLDAVKEIECCSAKISQHLHVGSCSGLLVCTVLLVLQVQELELNRTHIVDRSYPFLYLVILSSALSLSLK